MARKTIETPVWPAQNRTALLVSPLTEDHTSLEDLFREQNWRLESALTLRLAMLLLKAGPPPVVIVADDLWMGDWKELVTAARGLPDPPLIIVASENPDEALRLAVERAGGQDVISKPFTRTELCSVLPEAWRTRQDGQISSVAGEVSA